jgi:DNA-binding FadR family transcriptional regulator
MRGKVIGMDQRRNSPKLSAQSAVERIAGELRERALSAKDGDSLGSEEELSNEFGVSKPTLRQAARLLQYEDILQVKRGVHGGYFARRPQLDMIARLAGMHLRANKISPESISAVLDVLAPLAVSSVVNSGKTHLFRDYTVQEAKNPKDITSEDMVRTEGAFAKLFFELTGNPALRLIYSIFYQYGDTVPRRKGAQPGRADAIRLRVALAKALVARDLEQSTAIYLEYRRLIHSGIHQGAAKGAKTKSRKSSA